MPSSSSSSSSNVSKTSAKKQGSGMASFKQQELKAWQPVLTPVAVISMLIVVFVVFLPIGIVLEDCSNRVIEQSVRYDNETGCDEVDSSMNSSQLPKRCTLNFPLAYDFEPPIYFYYELRNFYQNHRRFTKSKSDPQLRGDGNEEQIEPYCDPLTDFNGKTIVPCGLFAGSFFEDRFRMDYKLPGENGYIPLCPHSTESDPCYFAQNTSQWNDKWSGWHTNGTWQKYGIAWQSDVDSKFKYIEIDDSREIRKGPRQNQSGLLLPRPNDQDFIVWMRAAALPNFRKLHRIIDDGLTLPKDTMVEIVIASWFPTKDFDGEKWIVIAKTEWCGGANHALAWAFIVVACCAIGLTVTFGILLLFGSRKMADVNRFSWHNRPTSNPMVSLA